jgi:exodeoxyribonuclease VII large subunit
VADVRAETPTAAAQLAVPSLQDLLSALHQRGMRLARGLSSILNNRRTRLAAVKPEKMHRLLDGQMNRLRQEIDEKWEEISSSINRRLERDKLWLDHAGENLNALNPFRVLQRGYALVLDRETGRYIGKASDTNPGKDVELRFQDGLVPAQVTGKATLRSSDL